MEWNGRCEFDITMRDAEAWQSNEFILNVSIQINASAVGGIKLKLSYLPPKTIFVFIKKTEIQNADTREAKSARFVQVEQLDCRSMKVYVFEVTHCGTDFRKTLALICSVSVFNFALASPLDATYPAIEGCVHYGPHCRANTLSYEGTC